MLITAFVQVRREGYQEPRNEVRFLSPVERLASFEPGNFRFWLQWLKPLGKGGKGNIIEEGDIVEKKMLDQMHSMVTFTRQHD